MLQHEIRLSICRGEKPFAHTTVQFRKQYWAQALRPYDGSILIHRAGEIAGQV